MVIEITLCTVSGVLQNLNQVGEENKKILYKNLQHTFLIKCVSLNLEKRKSTLKFLLHLNCVQRNVEDLKTQK